MHSVVDWFAFAVWQDGRLKRSLSLSPDSGVLEDIGAKLPFEEPYWSGKHPAVNPRRRRRRRSSLSVSLSAMLLGVFGDRYREYMARTGRLLPYVY
jgi:hypothetical protein